MSGDETSNITQTLTNLFEEMLMETEVTGENRSNVDFSQFLSALREQSTKNSSHEPLDFGTLVKLVDGWRTRLNLTRSSEPACTYCEGNFRDFILAYNSIHGYLSLIVSVIQLVWVLGFKREDMQLRAIAVNTRKGNAHHKLGVNERNDI